MFDTTPDVTAFGVVPSTPLGELRSFSGACQDALLDSAGLLGGSAGLRIAHIVLDGLAQPAKPSRRTMRALDELLELLRLDHVHDPSSIEAELFAAIDPSSTCVEEICLLADQLSDLLDTYREADAVDECSGRRAAA
ncbi:hypothetical protein SAMN04490244_107166 [Tranquillimonas rosea]|uniref:Uncharacterized protein n=1 Tax=Tranquillimonas rosea TaxID=641238 RepID=A0A1H9VJB2_9RHOB|nr:hypothetical protein [Tranquillimonas rosea]SES21846.1 hypothetical protein SAMN04490244_107166 [Tranquillimonas rosea]